MNKIIITGNLAANPELRTTQNGIAVCSFRVAVSRKFKKADGTRPTDFLPVVAWRGLAESCSKYLHKGSKVLVEGSAEVRDYEKDGHKVYVTEIQATDVEFLTPKGEDGQQGQGNQSYQKADPTPPPAQNQQQSNRAPNGDFKSEFEDTDEDLPF